MKKQKSTTINISEVSSSDDESQAKPKIDKEELKKYIKDSDDESSQEQITPKSSPQKPKVKRKKMLKLQDSPMVQPNKTISQKIIQKNLIPESDFRKLRKKAESLGADSLDYSKRKNYKYVVEYNGKKIHFGSAKTEDYINHKDKDRRQKYLNKAKKIKDKDGRLTYKLPFYPNFWSVNLLN